jgi:hypothetical protein
MDPREEVPSGGAEKKNCRGLFYMFDHLIWLI